MKTNFTFFLAIAVALFSCKKDNSNNAGVKHPTTTAVTRYPLLFSASAFAAQTSAFSTKKTVMSVKQTQSLADQIHYLSYYVTNIDSPGIIIKQVIQKSTNANFGTIRDTLPNGNYRVVFLGSTHKQMQVAPLSWDPSVPLSAQDLFISDGGGFFRSDSIGDNFVKVLNLTVTARTNYDVVMERIVGKAKVVIKDAIPANVARIDCVWSNFPGAYDLITNMSDQGSGSGLPDITFQHKVTTSNIGKKGFTFGISSFPAYMTIQIFAFDAAGNRLFTRYVSDNTQLNANTTVTFSGTLFNNASVSNVSVDPTWGASTTLPFTDY